MPESLAFLTLDIIILIVLTVLFFILSIYAGKKVSARIILLFYPTTLVFLNIPYITLDNAYLEVGAYALIFTALFFLLNKNLGAKKLYTGGRKFIDGVVLSISTTILLLILYYHILPLEQLYTFSLPFSSFFTEKVPYGIWIIIPVVALFLTNRSDS